MGLKDILTGGPEVRGARARIAELQARTSQNNRTRIQLEQARVITRRHTLGLILKSAGALAVLSVGGAVVLAIEGEEQKVKFSEIGDGITLEYGQKEVEEIARKCAKDLSLFSGVPVDEDRIVQSIKVCKTKDEFADLAEANNPGVITGDREFAKNNFAISTSNGRYIGFNKAAFDESLEGDSNAVGFKKALSVQVEEFIQHEVVHFTAASYPSEDLQRALYRNIFGVRYQGRRIVHDHVQGAHIVAKDLDKETLLSDFSFLEEVEAVVLTEALMAAKGRNKSTLIPTATARNWIEFFEGARMYQGVLRKIDPDLQVSSRHLASTRMRSGGREEFLRMIARANPDKSTSGKELEYGLFVMLAINTLDKENLRRLVTPK